jgi:retron-type reverse transcriptase
VGRVICTRSAGWILELDITGYFDSIVREQLMEMIEKRIRDGSVLQRIRKWIQVGVIDEGKFLVSETGQGKDKRLVRSWPTFTRTTYSTNGSRK